MDLTTANIPPGLTIIPAIIPTNRNTSNSSLVNSNPTSNNSSSNNGTSNETENRYSSRRVLRPRTEPRSYAEIESPDINLINGTAAEKSINGECDSDEDVPMPEIEFKELSAAEIWERERKLRRLREELRNEETKLVLLKKIKHSQHVMKENKTPTGSVPNVNPQNFNNPLSFLPQSLSKGSLTVIPTNLADYKGSSSRQQQSINDQAQCFPLPRQSLPGGATLSTGSSSRAPFIQGKVLEGRSSNLSITPSVTITPTTGPVMNLKTKNQSSMNLNNSVSITPTASISISQNSSISSRNSIGNNNIQSSNNVIEETQTQAQKQAAAKLALRKQLEKTLLQIPPPKPPPPEMHFIPNPSNGEFVYLLGLEHVVDYLTKDKKTNPQPQQPFKCAQCKIDFTPVWKMEKDKRAGSGADVVPKIICESCVTSNVKKALKAEHTNRLKTAFVKALQQEQEIEQRMAAQSSSSSSSTPTSAADFSVHSPAPIPSNNASIPQQNTASISLSPAPTHKPSRIVETSTPRPTPTPPNQPTPPPQSSSRNTSRHSSSAAVAAAAASSAMDPMSSMAFAAQLNALASLGNFGSLGNMGSFSNSSQQTAAAMQAFQQQLFRGIQGMTSGNQQANIAAQMQFGPLLYSYQLAMAQAAQQAQQQQQQQQQQAVKTANKSKSSKTPTSNNVAMDMQRALEMQRQYLEMLTQANQLPNQRGGHNNWKNN